MSQSPRTLPVEGAVIEPAFASPAASVSATTAQLAIANTWILNMGFLLRVVRFKSLAHRFRDGRTTTTSLSATQALRIDWPAEQIGPGLPGRGGTRSDGRSRHGSACLLGRRRQGPDQHGGVARISRKRRIDVAGPRGDEPDDIVKISAVVDAVNQGRIGWTRVGKGLS